MPTTSSARGEGGASTSAASADTAAVRSLVSNPASVASLGAPSGPMSVYQACTLGRPAAALAGSTLTCLTPNQPSSLAQGMVSQAPPSGASSCTRSATR